MNIYKVTRTIPCPVKDRDGNKMKSKYTLKPAVITVKATKAPEAAAFADEVQYNTKVQMWGAGKNEATPWGNPNMAWTEIPYNGEALELR